MYFLNFLRRLWQNQYNPGFHLLRLEIDSLRLKENLNFFKKAFPSYQIAAVIKGNAYGHGLKEIGLLLDKNLNVRFLALDNLIEAKTLRNLGIKKEILILNYIPQELLPSLKKIKNCSVVISSLFQAEVFKEKINFPLKVHLEVETGMNRQGINLKELLSTISLLSSNRKITIEGLMTHLADADSPSPSQTLKQLELWKEAVKIASKHLNLKFLHFAATAGTNYLKYAPSNLLRIGLGLYGFDTTKDKILKVKPLLSFWAKIINLKKISKGEKVGYNFSYEAKRDSWLALLPCGYYEGIPRALSNQGFVYWRDIPLPIVGLVNMNLTTIDVTSLSGKIKIEDEIEVISTNLEKLNSVPNLAKIIKTNPYEILTRISPTIKRIII